MPPEGPAPYALLSSQEKSGVDLMDRCISRKNRTILHISGFGGSRHGKAKQSRQALFLFPSGGSVLHYDFFALEGRDGRLSASSAFSAFFSLFWGPTGCIRWSGSFLASGIGIAWVEGISRIMCRITLFCRHAARLALFSFFTKKPLMKVGPFDQALEPR